MYTPVKLSAALVESFSGTFLSPLYDDPKPTPRFHREVWELYCSTSPQAAVAAPRNHAKSTALTHDFVLASMLFRTQMYAVIVSASEDMAKDHLHDISEEIHHNEDLQKFFEIEEIEVDQKTEIVVRCRDGYKFRILARGAEQKIRGGKWNGKRPGLIVCDDLEDDEQVENRERRRKLAKWFFRAAQQALRDGGQIRVHGTILHEDSLLSQLMKHPQWKHQLYKAHKSYDDFSEILWPEKFPEARLRLIQQNFINQDPPDPGGYAQEYLNDPFDSAEAYLRTDDFLPMSEEDREASKLVCAAADFAISTQDAANRTSFTIGGKCSRNLLHFLDQRVGRWDAFSIVEEMFSIQEAWHPEIFWVESGQIWTALYPLLEYEMQRRDIYLNVFPRAPIKDKASRGRSLQKRMRARGTRWDDRASWFPGMKYELLRFTGHGEARLDDQFDSAALLSLGFDNFKHVEEEDFLTEDEEQDALMSQRLRAQNSDGRNDVTGY